MHIILCAPDQRSVRYVNGMAQTTAAIVKALGPALPLSLSQFSLENEIAWGCGIYAFLAALALCLPVYLPRRPRRYGHMDDKISSI